MHTLIGLLLLVGNEPPAETLKKIDAKTLRGHIELLASDDLEGRAAGFPGNERAVEYLEAKLREYGLKPAGTGKGYRQPFEFKTRSGKRRAENVIALFEGTDPKLKRELVVIGAHLDHIGRVGQLVKKAKGDDTIWNGADDNASGTAVTLLIAKAFATTEVRAKRSFLFCFWNAEEQGLHGSRHWVDHPTRPLENAVYSVNLDMVGRNPERPIDVEGVGTSLGETLEDAIKAACKAEDLRITTYEYQHQALFRSDSRPFLGKGVPTTMFFASFHEDYHKPGDHADKVAYPRLEKVGRAVARVIYEVGNLEKRLIFNPEVPSRWKARVLGVTGEALKREGKGLYRLKRVYEGSVAEAAGLKDGDVIVKFGGETLPAEGTFRELRRRVLKMNPEEGVWIEAERDGETVTVEAKWER